MTAQTISVTIIALFLLILLAGFLFGLARGFNKSIVRLLIVICTIVVSFFATPSITNAVMSINISNLGITVGGSTMTSITDILVATLNQIPYVQDISGTEAYATIITVVPKMILNVVLFVVVFYLLRLVSMIIYWIIAGVCFGKKKTKGKNKHRLLGSLVGTVQNFLIVLVLLVPMVGLITTASDVEAQMSTTTTEQQSETSANAAATDEDYYYVLLSSDSEQSEEADVDAEETDSDSADSSDSTLDDVLKTSSEIIDIYHQTWVGKFLKSVGLEKLCNNVFGTLSTVEENGEQYNFHDEVVAFSGVYNDVLTLQSNGGFDLTNADSIKNLENIIDSCYNSKLAGKLIDEVIVTAVNKWNENQTFLGISKPNIDGYNDVIDSLLNALASAEDKHATLISTTKMLNSIMVTAKSLNSEDGLNIDSIGDLLNDITSDPVITDLAKQVIVGNIQTISEQSGLGDYADAFSEAITGIFSVDYSETDGNISDEISVITSTLNIAQKLSDSNEEVKVDADDAEAVVTALVNSTVLYDKIIDKNGEINSLIQSSIKDISEDDKTTISTAIEAAKDGLDETEDSAKLAKLQAIADLFGIDLSEQNGLPEDAAE